MKNAYYRNAIHALETGDGTPARNFRSSDKMQRDWSNRAKRIIKDEPFDR
jgi:hypothetical protein